MRYNRISHSTQVHLDADQSGSLVLNTPYDSAFLADFKGAIPAADRSWDNTGKVWLVAPVHADRLVDMIEQHYNVRVLPPQGLQTATAPTIAVLDVRYIGSIKPRDDGTVTAFGWCDGAWSVIFPEVVLMAWFGQASRPGEAQTLYAILGVERITTPAELKSRWRRLARQWHPDVCKEPDAREQFERIQTAYEVLSDERKRPRYDAGLLLEASLGKERHIVSEHTGFRSPLRCGLIMAEGYRAIGRFRVEKILGWQDIVNGNGQTLVTSWAAGDQHFAERWV